MKIAFIRAYKKAVCTDPCSPVIPSLMGQRVSLGKCMHMVLVSQEESLTIWGSFPSWDRWGGRSIPITASSWWFVFHECVLSLFEPILPCLLFQPYLERMWRGLGERRAQEKARYSMPPSYWSLLVRLAFSNARSLRPVGESGAMEIYLWWRRIKLGNI